MSYEPAELKAHIEAQGEGLKENIDEIQNRAKGVLDCRMFYENNTRIALGAAAASGLILGLLINRGPSVQSKFFEMGAMDDQRAAGRRRAQLSTTPRSVSHLREVADNTMSAVFALAADKFQDLMAEALPGFREHYTQSTANRSRPVEGEESFSRKLAK